MTRCLVFFGAFVTGFTSLSAQALSLTNKAVKVWQDSLEYPLPPVNRLDFRQMFLRQLAQTIEPYHPIENITLESIEKLGEFCNVSPKERGGFYSIPKTLEPPTPEVAHRFRDFLIARCNLVVFEYFRKAYRLFIVVYNYPDQKSPYVNDKTRFDTILLNEPLRVKGPTVLPEVTLGTARLLILQASERDWSSFERVAESRAASAYDAIKSEIEDSDHAN